MLHTRIGQNLNQMLDARIEMHESIQQVLNRIRTGAAEEEVESVVDVVRSDSSPQPTDAEKATPTVRARAAVSNRLAIVMNLGLLWVYEGNGRGVHGGHRAARVVGAV